MFWGLVGRREKAFCGRFAAKKIPACLHKRGHWTGINSRKKGTSTTGGQIWDEDICSNKVHLRKGFLER
jgi:hypothetical protein